MATIEERVSRLEGNLEQINARLASIETGIIDLRREMTEEIGNLRREIIDLRREMTANFRWTIGTILLVWMTLTGALAGVFSVILTRLTP